MVGVALVFSLASCADLGAGEDESSYAEYFSGVYVLSDSGLQKCSITDFGASVSTEDTDIPTVIPCAEYSYIGFRVADGYTLYLSEFAFFARTDSHNGTLELEFYIVDEMPTSIKDKDGNDVEISSPDDEADEDTETETDTEKDTETEGSEDSEKNEGAKEEDLFSSEMSFRRATFSVGEEWDSVLLEFGGAQTVNERQYVVVRIKNNCYSSSESEEQDVPAPVSFTFNYLLFYVNNAHKQ